MQRTRDIPHFRKNAPILEFDDRQSNFYFSATKISFSFMKFRMEITRFAEEI